MCHLIPPSSRPRVGWVGWVSAWCMRTRQMRPSCLDCVPAALLVLSRRRVRLAVWFLHGSGPGGQCSSFSAAHRRAGGVATSPVCMLKGQARYRNRQQSTVISYPSCSI